MVNIVTRFKTLFFNGLIRFFALRNDDTRIPSLGACEAIRKKQNIKTLQNNSIDIASCTTNTS